MLSPADFKICVNNVFETVAFQQQLQKPVLPKGMLTCGS